MKLGTVALLLMAAWFVLRWVRKTVREARSRKLPGGVDRPAAALRPFSDSHYDACMQALRAFSTEYRLTFQHGQCDKKHLLGLHALREDALRHMYQLRMRLPNDLDAEHAFTQYIEDTDRLLKHYLQEAQKRCGFELLHPGPIDDTFYKKFYRAANDVAA